MTAYDRWIVENEAGVTLVEELDGWSYMSAIKRGQQTRWERPLDLSKPDDRATYEKYKSA